MRLREQSEKREGSRLSFFRKSNIQEKRERSKLSLLSLRNSEKSDKQYKNCICTAHPPVSYLGRYCRIHYTPFSLQIYPRVTFTSAIILHIRNNVNISGIVSCSPIYSMSEIPLTKIEIFKTYCPPSLNFLFVMYTYSKVFL